MKVNNPAELAPLVSVGQRQVARAAEPQDRVSVDGARGLQQWVEGLRASSGQDRAAQVQQVILAVREGRYQVNPQRVAERMLDEADLAAQVRSALGSGAAE